MTKTQLEKLRTFDGSSMLLKALNKKTVGVFDAWVRQNHPGEVFDENQLETMGDLGKTVIKYKGRIALIRVSKDVLRYTFISSIFGDKITEK